MVTDLLEFARDRALGHMPLCLQRCSLRTICRQVLAEVQLAEPSRVLQLEADADGFGHWDPDRMAQVLTNLIGNALKHGSPHGRVRVTLEEQAELVIIAIHNSGTPIPSSELPHIFDPFRRATRGRASPGGLGLGLYIAQLIVRAHGGHIEVSSECDETVFRVVLARGRSPGRA